MKKYLASGVGGAAALMMVLLVMVFSAAPANAINEYAGRTYGSAAESINGWGGTIVISSRIGEYLKTDDCMVTGSRFPSLMDSSGRKRGGVVYLDLDCNDTVASANHPGHSLGTAEGRQAKEYKDAGARISKAYEDAVAEGKESWCQKDVAGCKYACLTLYKSCSKAVLDFLGA